MHTHQTVSDVLQSRWESDLPDKVLEVLRHYEGKPITTRIANDKRLPAMSGGWRLRREYGMTHLESMDYSRTAGNSGYSILLCHTESSVPLDCNNVLERNTCYFSARVARNHARMEAMNTKPVLDAAASAMNRIEAAFAALESAKADLDKLTAYGEPLHPDSFELERVCGLRDKKGEKVRL